MLSVFITPWIEAFDHVIGERAQCIDAIVRIKMFEVPKAHEARRHACDDRRGLDFLAAHRLVGADHAQRARGRNAEVMHGFRTQIFADRRTQHRAAVAHARIGCAARAFELQLEALAIVFDLAETERAAVAELARPHAELMPRIHRRIRQRFGRPFTRGVAREQFGEARIILEPGL